MPTVTRLHSPRLIQLLFIWFLAAIVVRDSGASADLVAPIEGEIGDIRFSASDRSLPVGRLLAVKINNGPGVDSSLSESAADVPESRLIWVEATCCCGAFAAVGHLFTATVIRPKLFRSSCR